MKKTYVATSVVAAGIIGSVPMTAETTTTNGASSNPVSIELSSGDCESTELVSSINFASTPIFNINCSYSLDHIWVQAAGDNCIIGLTDYAQQQLGEIVFVDIYTVGERIDRDWVFGTVESVKTVTDLFMPVNGEIIEYNSLLDDKPAIINSDPYGSGWIVKVKLENPSELSELMNSEEYRQHCSY